MPQRTSNAVWEGGLKSGQGKMKLGSGAYEGPFSFLSRFEDGAGTNPEELIAAAHAGCLSMALSAALEKAGTPVERVSTEARATVEKVEAGFRITKMHLKVRGKVPGIDAAGFKAAAEAAKEGCPVSNALKGNVTFFLDADLEA